MSAPRPLDLPPLSDCAWGGIPDRSGRDLLTLAGIARDVCSGLFVSGRSLESIAADSVRLALEDGATVALEIDADNRVVHASAGGLRRSARLCGEAGAVVLPVGTHRVFFEHGEAPSPPAPVPPSPAGPDGDVDTAMLAAGIDAAFPAAPDIATAALVVCHRGRIVAERYGAGAHAAMPLASWSMGKSLCATFIGILIGEGRLALDDPAPLAEWRRAGDPRGAITVRHLLNMSGGLDFSAEWTPDFRPADGYPDHSFMYPGAVDVVRLALSRPQRHKPGTVGLYLNADTLALQEIVRRIVEGGGERLRDWQERTLFAPLGMTSMRLEADPYGNQVLSGFVLGSGRDWTTLATLWLQDGVWNGRRILGEGFVRFCRTPAPGWRGRYWMATPPEEFADSVYGGQVWLNRFAEGERWPLPEDAYYMLGIGGQYAWIVPSRELTIVRLGHVRGMRERGAGREPLAHAFGQIAAAFPEAGARA